MKSQLLTHGSFFWHSINKAIEEVVPPVWSLHPVPEPECCSNPHTYTYTIEPMADVCHRYLHARRSWPPGSGWLLLEMIFVWMSSTQPEQCQQGHLTAEGDVFRGWHPQSPSLWQWPTICECPFTDFCISWGISHETSSLHYPQSNGFTKACIKSIKDALQQAKYSGADPQLVLLALWATPIDTKLPSPAELLYQCQLRTTIPAKIVNNDPSAIQVHEQIDTCSEAAKSQADKCIKTLVPLYAGQPVAMYDTLQKIWVPAIVICVLPQNSYEVWTSNGSKYCHMWRHLCECSVKAVDTVPSGTTATLQAPTRHCFSAAQPALPSPAQCMQPTSTPPATLATQVNQAPAVLAMPAVQRNAPAPMPVTSHATPVQPQRSGCVCMAPQSLIQEIKNYQPRLSTDLVLVMHHCIHPQSIVVELNYSILYSQKGECCIIIHFISRDWSLNQLTSVSWYIYILVSCFYHTWHLDLRELGCRYVSVQ